MSDFREVQISELFTPTSGKPLYIRDYLEAHPGEYPVYSASLTAPFGWIDSYNFDGAFLTWVMNGYGGRMQEVTGKFSINRDRGVLVPRDEVQTPNLTYLRYLLEPIFSQEAVGRRVDGRKNEYTKLYPPTVAEISMQLPTAASGDLDFDAMDKLGGRLKKIEAAKSELGTIEHDLRDAELAFEVPDPVVEVTLGDTQRFRLSIGSRILLKEVTEASIPIYSANVRKPFGYYASSGSLSFDYPSLIWGIDGNFDWNLIDKLAKFVPTDHCGRAEVLDPDLDPEYLLYALRSTRARYGFDRVYRANLGNVAREVTIGVPATDEGRPSLSRQQQIADSHRKLLGLKANSLIALDEILASRLALQP